MKNAGGTTSGLRWQLLPQATVYAPDLGIHTLLVSHQGGNLPPIVAPSLVDLYMSLRNKAVGLQLQQKQFYVHPGRFPLYCEPKYHDANFSAMFFYI